MKRHAGMNRLYRLVWNTALGIWVAVAENAKGKSRGGAASAAAVAMAMASLFCFTPQAQAANAADAAIVGGAGSVSTAGGTTTITQSTARMAIDWTSLSTAAHEALVFNQPNAAAIALNRITGANPSELLGSLTANGQVFISNPNGILFGAGAQVNVGGLAASTLSMGSADFMAGSNTFANSGQSGAVVNKGQLVAAPGGYLALLAPEVRNEGVMSATLGTALLAAGNKVTLSLNDGSLLGYSIDQGAIKALAENSQLIQADGGQVLLSARALDTLTTATVNNTGVIEARTMQGKAGRILLMGDMDTGTVNVGGTLDATAAAGDGGFIETSAAHVKINPDAVVKTLAAAGTSGTWLIDPNDFTVGVGGDMTSADVYNALWNNGRVEISTATSGTAGGNGDIFFTTPLTWQHAGVLTLNAQRDIVISAEISTLKVIYELVPTGSLTLKAGRDILVTAPVHVDTLTLLGGSWRQVGALPAFSVANLQIQAGTFLRAAGGDGLSAATAYLITDLAGLQGIQSVGMLDKYFKLLNDIDATSTKKWINAQAHTTPGFIPIGGHGFAAFTGGFDGDGHTITGLYVDTGSGDPEGAGLFAITGAGSVIRNIGLVNAQISGSANVGGLVGSLSGTINNSYVIGRGGINGGDNIGGLVGINRGGTITDSYAGLQISGSGFVGGLVGYNQGTINGSYATGYVRTSPSVNNVGGLVGVNSGTITNSYAKGDVEGHINVGGLVGDNRGVISGSYATGGAFAAVRAGRLDPDQAGGNAGGLVGVNNGSISDSYATGGATAEAGRLIGQNAGGLAGVNNGTIGNSYATGKVNGGANLGGLVGNGAGKVSNSYWDKTTTGREQSVGSDDSFGKTTAQMRQLSTFADWSISTDPASGTTWVIDAGKSAPVLRLAGGSRSLGSVGGFPRFDGIGAGDGYDPGYTSALQMVGAADDAVDTTGATGPITTPTALPNSAGTLTARLNAAAREAADNEDDSRQ